MTRFLGREGFTPMSIIAPATLLEVPDNLSASSDLYALKSFSCVLTSINFQIIINLSFHNKH